MSIIFYYLELFFLILLGAQALYSLVFAVASTFKHRSPVNPNPEQLKSFTLLFPAYMEDAIILNSAKQALALNYPSDKLRVIIGSDQMKEETVAQLRSENIDVVVMNFDHSTKSKNLLSQVQHAKEDFWPDYFIVMDADNKMPPDTLLEINKCVNDDFKVYQTHRTAKNSNTKLAVLDGITEEISNSIFRKGHRNLGFSCSLIGSGMVFDSNFLEEALEGINKDSAVEDKLLEFYILEREEKIAYLEDIYVYDEKVASGKNFSNQRKRWIAGQIDAFRSHIGPGIGKLLRGNVDFFDKAFQMGLIPKLLFAFVLALAAGLSLLLQGSVYWFYLLGAYAFALLISVPRRYYVLKNLALFIEIPKAIFFMLLAVLRIRKNQSVKQFEHTEKTFVEKED
jgi:cellulose synthase/poly-beta-1,6-N-acetylglucosamine synthase-like glycosyltransferase